jgi:YHS domain-containing protein
MKQQLSILVGLVLAFCAAEAAPVLNNLDKEGCAIFGYDPVAFFTIGQPVKGRGEFTTEHGGARYRFASRKHKELFEANPAKYVPQFGGYCAFGVSRGALAPIKIEAWQIVNGRLLMQKSESIRDEFNQDSSGNLKKADANWPGLVIKKGK